MTRAALIFIAILVSHSAFAWNTPGVQKMGNTNLKWLWTGAGGDSLWTNGANWCGTRRNGVCEGASSGPPTSGSSIFFDDTCVANGNNCSPTGIPGGSFTFIGIHMKSSFTGTIAFGATNVTVGGTFLLDGGTFSKVGGTLTVGNFRMTGGTFSGGTGNITFGGAAGNVVVMSGGSFTSTTGTMFVTSDTFNLTGLTSFTHSSGIINMATTGNSTSIFPAGFTFNSLVLRACNRTFTLNGPIVLDGDITKTVTGSSACTTTVNNHYIELKSGNMIKQSGNSAGSTIVRFTGSGEQTITTTTANRGIFPVEVVQAVTGSVKLLSTVSLQGWTDNASLGTVNTNGQMVQMWRGTYNSTVLTWPQVYAVGPSNNFTAFTNFSVTDLVLASASTAIGAPTGEIKVYGNITAAAGSLGWAGNVVTSMVGPGAQNIDLTSATTQYFPHLKINKPSGNLTFTGVPIISGGFTYVTGSYTMPTAVQFGNGTTGGTATITSNGFNFGDVDFVGYNTYVIADDMNITGNLGIENTPATGVINGPGFMRVTGNVSSAAGALGFYPTSSMTGIKLVGTSQTVAFPSSPSLRLPGFHFNSSTGATVTGTFALHSTTSGTMIDHISGTVDATGSSITFSSTGAPTWTLKMGTIQFGDVSTPNNAVMNITGSTMTVNGSLTLAALTSGRNLNGPIDAFGDVTYSGWGWGGSHTLTFRGNTSTFSIVGTPAYTNQNVTVSKTAGQKLNLGTDIAIPSTRSLNVTSGQVDLAGYDLTISGGGALSLSGTSVKLSGGTLSVNGGDVSPGPYGGGTIVP